MQYSLLGQDKQLFFIHLKNVINSRFLGKKFSFVNAINAAIRNIRMYGFVFNSILKSGFTFSLSTNDIVLLNSIFECWPNFLKEILVQQIKFDITHIPHNTTVTKDEIEKNIKNVQVLKAFFDSYKDMLAKVFNPELAIYQTLCDISFVNNLNLHLNIPTDLESVNSLWNRQNRNIKLYSSLMQGKIQILKELQVFPSNLVDKSFISQLPIFFIKVENQVAMYWDYKVGKFVEFHGMAPHEFMDNFLLLKKENCDHNLEWFFEQAIREVCLEFLQKKENFLPLKEELDDFGFEETEDKTYDFQLNSFLDIVKRRSLDGDLATYFASLQGDIETMFINSRTTKRNTNKRKTNANTFEQIWTKYSFRRLQR